jgi:thioredoxin 1
MVVSGSDARAVTPVKSGGLETATTGADEVETASAGADVVAVTGQVTDVCKDTFWPTVKAAGPKLVVLDMYTQWYVLTPLVSLFQLVSLMKYSSTLTSSHHTR